MNMNMLRRIAGKSDHKLHMHCSIILSGSRVLSTGYNVRDIHAEINAIKRLDRIYRPGNSVKSNHSLHLISFMVRRRNGLIGNSLPCPSCMEEIKLANVRTITYFDSRGVVNQVKLI